MTMFKTVAVAVAAFSYCSSAKVFEVTDSLPNSPIPYVVRHLEGPKVQLADDVFRTLTDTATTSNGSSDPVAAGFSMLLTNGKPNQIVPPHYHVHWHETFIPMTGQVRVWANGKPRDLGAGDFAMVPAYTRHSYQFVAQETEFLGLIQPAGFDEFFLNVSSPWNPVYNVPFPPDQAIAFPTNAYQAVAKQFDINVAPMNTSTPVGGADWHEANGTLPADHQTAYFLANGEGPHYWLESVGAVISPLATPIQTAGNFTISQISMRKTLNGTHPGWCSSEHQFIYGMDGEVKVRLAGEEVRLIKGDALFIPANTNFTLVSSVNYNKFLLCASGSDGIDTQMVEAGEGWPYSTPPAH
ncbi:hypothetical protein LTR85_003221 [Meristemomyces frigidus]|nr:hypothetical protein LTR85_003221 [Meristemomyces frigidus]